MCFDVNLMNDWRAMNLTVRLASRYQGQQKRERLSKDHHMDFVKNFTLIGALGYKYYSKY